MAQKKASARRPKRKQDRRLPRATHLTLAREVREVRAVEKAAAAFLKAYGPAMKELEKH